MRRVIGAFELALFAAALYLVFIPAMYLRGTMTKLIILNERTGERRVLTFRYRWLAVVRSWFVAFPDWGLAKVTRVEIAPVRSSE